MVFGRQIIVSASSLPNAHERQMALEVAAFAGRSFDGLDAPAIDGVLHDGVTPTSNPQPVQLQYNAKGGDDRIREDAIDHAYKSTAWLTFTCTLNLLIQM